MTQGHTENPQETRRSWWGTCRASCRSLQFKASLLVVVVVVAATAFGVAISTRMVSLVLYDNDHSQTQEWANSLAAGTSEAVESHDRESLTHTANDLIKTRVVAYAAFADASGRLLASAEARAGLLESALTADGTVLDLKPMHTSKIIRYKEAGLTCAEVVVPVYSTTPLRRTGQTSRPIVGYLRLSADVSETRDKLEQFGSYLSRVGIAFVLLVVPCSLLVTRHVVAPLNELAGTARAIANGATDARASVNANNELGDLAASFNTMANRLTSSQLELLELNAELERRVQERTRELEELAARDPLTGLYNRRHFTEEITREFAAAERYDADLTCLMFDLDHFKQINDQFGHRTGDEVLMTLARAIAAELRGSDVAARFGGDEFIVLLPQTSASAASVLVERIVSRFGEDFAQRLPEVPGGVSVGVASMRTSRPSSAEALIHEADVALYAAKEARRSHAPAANANVPAAYAQGNG